MYESIKNGKIVNVDEQETISDGTAGGLEEDTITLSICKDVIDEFVLLSEDEICEALIELVKKEHLMVEGAAALAFAGYLKISKEVVYENVVILLCGKNISYNKLLKLIK
jgi:threonine dehydratase